MKKLLILLISLFIGGLFSYGFWEGYTDYVYGTEMFLVKINQPIEDDSIETWTFGKVAKREGWDKASKKIEEGALESCESCNPIERVKLDKLPSEYEGIFENKPVRSAYLSIDTPDLAISDTRMFIVSEEFEFLYENCLPQAEQLRETMKKYDAVVTCVKNLTSQ